MTIRLQKGEEKTREKVPGCGKGIAGFLSHCYFLLLVFGRVSKITAAIAPEVQAKRRAEYRKTLPAKVLNAGLLQHIKKTAWEKD